MYEAQIEVLNRNNTGSSFSVNPRLLCVWLLPTGIEEEVHVNSMADLTAAQPWRARSWMMLSRSNDIFLCLVTYPFAEGGGDRGSLFATPVLVWRWARAVWQWWHCLPTTVAWCFCCENRGVQGDCRVYWGPCFILMAKPLT